MQKKCRGLTAVLFLLFGICFSMDAAAAYPPISDARPLKAYGWQSKKYTVYTDEKLAEQMCVLSYGECEVVAISKNAAQIRYKEDNTMKKGWIPLTKLVYNPEYAYQVSYANADLTLYRRPTVKAPYIMIPQFSGGVTVSERGSWTEVLFRSGSAYYLGWIKTSTHQSMVRLSMETTTQPLANGIYTISPRNAVTKALTCETGGSKFKLAANRKAGTQRFRLRYVADGYYLVTPLKEKGNLTDAGGRLKAREDGCLWKLSRSGGCFYIQSKDSRRGLRYASGRVSAAAFRKDKAQQWKFVKISRKPTKESSIVFSQYDPKWGGSTYYAGPTRRTISTSGCGVVALTNAVYALNGEFINPAKIARFSVSRGHYFYNQGTADTLYPDFAKKYGKMYHFKHNGKTYSLSKVKQHLLKGRVAVALVPGHYIAIVGYRSSDGCFLVLDSAIYGKRPTTIYGDWVSAATLGQGTLRCEYFHILSRQ